MEQTSTAYIYPCDRPLLTNALQNARKVAYDAPRARFWSVAVNWSGFYAISATSSTSTIVGMHEPLTEAENIHSLAVTRNGDALVRFTQRVAGGLCPWLAWFQLDALTNTVVQRKCVNLGTIFRQHGRGPMPNGRYNSAYEVGTCSHYATATHDELLFVFDLERDCEVVRCVNIGFPPELRPMTDSIRPMGCHYNETTGCIRHVANIRRHNLKAEVVGYVEFDPRADRGSDATPIPFRELVRIPTSAGTVLYAVAHRDRLPSVTANISGMLGADVEHPEAFALASSEDAGVVRTFQLSIKAIPAERKSNSLMYTWCCMPHANVLMVGGATLSRATPYLAVCLLGAEQWSVDWHAWAPAAFRDAARAVVLLRSHASCEGTWGALPAEIIEYCIMVLWQAVRAAESPFVMPS